MKAHSMKTRPKPAKTAVKGRTKQKRGKRGPYKRKKYKKRFTAFSPGGPKKIRFYTVPEQVMKRSPDSYHAGSFYGLEPPTYTLAPGSQMPKRLTTLELLNPELLQPQSSPPPMASDRSNESSPTIPPMKSDDFMLKDAYLNSSPWLDTPFGNANPNIPTALPMETEITHLSKPLTMGELFPEPMERSYSAPAGFRPTTRSGAIPVRTGPSRSFSAPGVGMIPPMVSVPGLEAPGMNVPNMNTPRVTQPRMSFPRMTAEQAFVQEDFGQPGGEKRVINNLFPELSKIYKGRTIRSSERSPGATFSRRFYSRPFNWIE